MELTDTNRSRAWPSKVIGKGWSISCMQFWRYIIYRSDWYKASRFFYFFSFLWQIPYFWRDERTWTSSLPWIISNAGRPSWIFASSESFFPSTGLLWLEISCICTSEETLLQILWKIINWLVVVNFILFLIISGHLCKNRFSFFFCKYIIDNKKCKIYIKHNWYINKTWCQGQKPETTMCLHKSGFMA